MIVNEINSLLQFRLLLPPPLGTQVLDDGLDVFTWFLPQKKKNGHSEGEEAAAALSSCCSSLAPHLQLQLLVPLGHANEEFLVVDGSRAELVVLHHGLSRLHVGHLQEGLEEEHRVTAAPAVAES